MNTLTKALQILRNRAKAKTVQKSTTHDAVLANTTFVYRVILYYAALVQFSRRTSLAYLTSISLPTLHSPYLIIMAGSLENARTTVSNTTLGQVLPKFATRNLVIVELPFKTLSLKDALDFLA